MILSRLTGRGRPGVQRVRLGVVHSVLETRFCGLLREFRSLYESFITDEPASDEIRVRVDQQPFSLRHRARYQVTVNDRLIFEPGRPDELLPYVEWVDQLGGASGVAGLPAPARLQPGGGGAGRDPAG